MGVLRTTSQPLVPVVDRGFRSREDYMPWRRRSNTLNQSGKASTGHPE